MCSITRNTLRNRFYWGNLQGKGSKRRHKHPDIPTFPLRGMPGSSGRTVPASCFYLLGGSYENKLISVGRDCCGAKGIMYPEKLAALSLETLRLMTGVLSLLSVVGTHFGEVE